MEQVEALKPVTIQVNLSNHFRKVPMHNLFGDILFREEVVVCSIWVVLVCLEVFVLYYLRFYSFVFVGGFLGAWNFLDRRQ